MNISPSAKVKLLYAKYERYFSPLALLAGFVWDNLTLRRIDLWAENLIIIVYLFVAGLAITIINLYEAGRLRRRLFERLAVLSPYLLQFSFGGLFSVFVVFYSRSASLVTSWPFLLALAGLLVGNELFRRSYQRLTFQLAIFFVAVFSYSVFALPLIVGRIGPAIFLLSGLASLSLLAVFALLLSLIVADRWRTSRLRLAVAAGVIYLGFNVLYFANLIPPIPLSLKEIGLYHRLERTGGGYIASYEPAAWYQPFEQTAAVFHWRPGQPVYIFSAVFAPAKFSAKIMHRWSYFDEQANGWQIKDQLGFPMVGGRDGGYRGYSLKYNIQPGRWRVEVLTERGQVLGRLNFTVVAAERPLELEIKML